MAILNNITFYRGENVNLTWTMTPTTDITGWTITFTLRLNANDTSAVYTATATLTNPSQGIFTVNINHANSVLLLGAYAYDCQRSDSGSEAVLSIGTITVNQEVLYP